MSDHTKIVLYRLAGVCAGVGWLGWGVEILRGTRNGPWAVVAFVTLGVFLAASWWVRPIRQSTGDR